MANILKIEEKFVDTKYGKLYYLEAGEGERDFYFFHGYWGDPEGIKFLAPNIYPLRFRVIDFYLPGHGKSFWLPRKTNHQEINILLSDAIKTISMNKSVVIMGESMGGGMAVGVHRVLRNQIVGMILCNPLLKGNKKWLVPKVAYGLTVDFFKDHGKMLLRKYKNPIPRINVPKIKRNNLIKAVLNLPLITNFELDLNNIGSKILILKGKDDHAVPNITIDKAEVKYFDGGHYWFIYQYEVFYKEITGFLKQI